MGDCCCVGSSTMTGVIPPFAPRSKFGRGASLFQDQANRKTLDRLEDFANLNSKSLRPTERRGDGGFPLARTKHPITPVICTRRIFPSRGNQRVRTSTKSGVSFTSSGLHRFTPANSIAENRNEIKEVCRVYTANRLETECVLIKGFRYAQTA
jgi:hypothetical protein